MPAAPLSVVQPRRRFEAGPVGDLHRFIHDLNIFRQVRLLNRLKFLFRPSVSVNLHLSLRVVWAVLIQGEKELLSFCCYHLGLKMVELNTVFSFQFSSAILGVSCIRFVKFFVVITF